MKHFSYLFVMMLCLFLGSINISAQQISKDDAQVIAKQFLKGSNRLKKATGTEIGNVALVYTEKSEKDGETNLYVFNGEQDGFVIVAGDERCSNLILGFSDENSFDASEMPSNIKYWLKGYSIQIDQIKESKANVSGNSQSAKANYIRKASSTNINMPIVSPLLTKNGTEITWKQGAPFNGKAPYIGQSQCITGCVATAMAQIMYYWEWPIKGTGSNSYTWKEQTLSSTFNDHTYNWSIMKPTTNKNTTEEQKNAVAQLLYDCGVSVNMNYGVGSGGDHGSSATSENARTALRKNFGYANSTGIRYRFNYTNEEWESILIDELKKRRPILYGGQDKSGQGGHAFVCDGYGEQGKKNYFHFNWGWDGSSNGYYTISCDPDNYEFSDNQDIITGIRPDNDEDWTDWRDYGEGTYTYQFEGIQQSSGKVSIKGKHSIDNEFHEIKVTNWGINTSKYYSNYSHEQNSVEAIYMINNETNEITVPRFDIGYTFYQNSDTPNPVICSDIENSIFGNQNITGFLKKEYNPYYDSNNKELSLSLIYTCQVNQENRYYSWNISDVLALQSDFEYFRLTVSDVGYATMYLDYAAVIPAGVSVYYANSSSSTSVQLEEISDIIPANTGVIVKAASGTYKFAQAQSNPSNISGNLLKGSVSKTTFTGKESNAYILAKGNDGSAVFKRPSAGKLNGYKAWLDLSDSNAKTIYLDDLVSTSISAVNANKDVKASGSFNLAGQHVNEGYKGFVIKNGKKYWLNK